MAAYKIILFLCNWGAYTAWQELQHGGFQIPAGIHTVRVPCTGRISRALLFKPFEMGADGVILAGCSAGSCRHGAGTSSARDNVEALTSIIDLLGIGGARMRLATFLPHESDALKTFLEGFCEEIKALGKSPVLSSRYETAAQPRVDCSSIAAIVRQHDVYSCQDCGKCTSSCPLALSGKAFSPHAIANAAIRGDVWTDQMQKDIQSCLTCGICHERCPADVNFPGFIRDMRRCTHEYGGGSAVLPHGGFFHSMMRTMASPAVASNRWRHVADDLQLDPQGKVMFFGGCAPYFDAFFHKQQGVKTTDIETDALRLLNFFDVHPRISSSERCCGHDLLWSGDRANFLRLAKLNVETIRDSGVEEVITSCPECYRTLAIDYENNGVRTGFKVTHLYAFLEEEIDKGGVAFQPLRKKITYQDSCRLNRLEGQRALPRKLIHRLSHALFTEMRDSGLSALCCGNCSWTRCDAHNKALQAKRIWQARDSGSELMVTSCPKCQIHLSCAMDDPYLRDGLFMKMVDLTSVIARTIYRE